VLPNPLSDVTVIVELPEKPALIVKVEGEAEREKSGTVTDTVTVIECVSDPLEPVTVTEYDPAAALDGTVIDRVDVKLGVLEVGVRLTVQRLG
jgi:hypothetical protein